MLLYMTNHNAGGVFCHNGSSQSADNNGEAKGVHSTPSGHSSHHEPHRRINIV